MEREWQREVGQQITTLGTRNVPVVSFYHKSCESSDCINSILRHCTLYTIFLFGISPKNKKTIRYWKWRHFVYIVLLVEKKKGPHLNLYLQKYCKFTPYVFLKIYGNNSICCYFLDNVIKVWGGFNPQSDDHSSAECVWKGRDPNTTKTPTQGQQLTKMWYR